ncbi:MAG: hypothetical protein ACOC5T_07275 [Elusimicrobiota bacterium]
MYKYVYKNKKTGKRVYSNKKLRNKDLELVRSVRNTKQKKIIKK